MVCNHIKMSEQEQNTDTPTHTQTHIHTIFTDTTSLF
jgi:hypothetical protein